MVADFANDVFRVRTRCGNKCITFIRIQQFSQKSLEISNFTYTYLYSLIQSNPVTTAHLAPGLSQSPVRLFLNLLPDSLRDPSVECGLFRRDLKRHLIAKD